MHPYQRPTFASMSIRDVSHSHISSNFVASLSLSYSDTPLIHPNIFISVVSKNLSFFLCSFCVSILVLHAAARVWRWFRLYWLSVFWGELVSENTFLQEIFFWKGLFRGGRALLWDLLARVSIVDIYSKRKLLDCIVLVVARLHRTDVISGALKTSSIYI